MGKNERYETTIQWKEFSFGVEKYVKPFCSYPINLPPTPNAKMNLNQEPYTEKKNLLNLIIYQLSIVIVSLHEWKKLPALRKHRSGIYSEVAKFYNYIMAVINYLHFNDKGSFIELPQICRCFIIVPYATPTSHRLKFVNKAVKMATCIKSTHSLN